MIRCCAACAAFLIALGGGVGGGGVGGGGVGGGGGDTLDYAFVGQVDELTIYDRALTATELAAIAASPGGKCK